MNWKLLLVVSLAVAAQQPIGTGFSPERVARLKTALKETVDKKEFAGIHVAVMKKSKLAINESFGYQDMEAGKPMRADTIMRMASMTKPIASAAVMILYEEGKFHLDDPISKWIPGMEKVRVLESEDSDGTHTVPLKREITVKHLLTHTSGLYNSRAYAKHGTFGRNLTLKEMAAKLPEVPLSHQPGEAWRYGMSIDVLGYLVEVWSGKTFDVFLQERIFTPLGMKDTGFHVPKEKMDRVSKVYTLGEGGVVRPAQQRGDPSVRPKFFSGGGGLFSTAPDYLRFCQMLINGGMLDGKRILARTTVDYMFRNHVPVNMIVPEGPNGRTGHGFGFGGAVLVDPSAYQVLSVEGDYNWGGANGTYFWIDRKNEMAAVWMVQRPPFTAPPSKRFKILVYQALE